MVDYIAIVNAQLDQHASSIAAHSKGKPWLILEDVIISLSQLISTSMFFNIV